MSRDERRKYPRIEAKVKVAFKTKEEFILEYSKNISRGGMFLKTDHLLDPNADIELSLSFPEAKEEFTVRGRVVRLMSLSHPFDVGKQIYGVGIRFVGLDPEFEARIEKLLASQGLACRSEE